MFWLTRKMYEVDPDEKPPRVAVAGLVTPVPGEYQVRVALLARTARSPNARRIALTIPVRMVAPDAA